MNPFFKIILKLLSSPRIDIQEDYQSIRKLQQFFYAKPKKTYRILDDQIYAEDQSHEIGVRVFQPKEQKYSEPVLYIHGGGWVIGDIDSYTRACINLADTLGRTIYSVDYRLAPEYPYPAGLKDCFRVAEILLEQLEFTGPGDVSKWIIMGDSAGGNLAAVVSLLLRNRGLTIPYKQVLLYPVTYWDHSEQSPFESIRANGHEYGLTIDKIQSYMKLYVPDETDRKDYRVAPLMAEDLSNQPETLVITAEYDPLCDEGEAYAKALFEAGNKVRLHRVNNAVHGFVTYPKFAAPLDEAYRIMNDFLTRT
ncbi:alpha/beta hydrolase [Marinilactibacillus psychrotolerans]|uniref:Alpha/beta hydrolase n=2 Tax=Marinilactibacillus psychrotolerans TaxID=191770 RepID=A0ABW8UJI4_9LACT|nr:alpha/beta hydrolase [Marinilactibacillus psychrotolerans]GEQ34006.1 esterase/lipase [Marinilactibacillus psychrotolerans]SJN27740.1 Esterase/lipase [Marinilactibacillus psychrotolerans 42ea]